MPDYFDRVETELRHAALRVPATSRRRDPFRILGPTVGVALATGVAVVIVALAGHRVATTVSTKHAASRPLPEPCLAIGTPRCLVEQYQVLRRPQTRAEQRIRLRVPASAFFAGQALHDVHITLVPTLTRTVSLGHRERVIVFVIRSSLGGPDFYLGAKLISPIEAGYLAANWPFIPTGSSTSRMGGWWLFPSRPTAFNGVSLAIVPDRVAVVRWVYPVNRTGVAPVRSIHVHENIVSATVPPHSGEPTVTEYGANGRLIASTPAIATPPHP